MPLPSASTLKLDGRVKRLGLTTTERSDILVHAVGLDEEPVVENGGALVSLDLGIVRFRVKPRKARITVSSQVAWALNLDGVVSDFRANLTALDLRGIVMDGVFSDCSLDLPAPQGMVRIDIDGVVRGLSLRRPAGVPIRVTTDGPRKNFHLGTAVDAESDEEWDEGIAGYNISINGPVWGLGIAETPTKE